MMNFSQKDKSKTDYPPSNVSSDYYTDHVYSTDAFYGFREEHRDIDDAGIKEVSDADSEEALDEPIESWGWINNVDNKRV